MWIKCLETVGVICLSEKCILSPNLALSIIQEVVIGRNISEVDPRHREDEAIRSNAGDSNEVEGCCGLRVFVSFGNLVEAPIQEKYKSLAMHTNNKRKLKANDIMKSKMKSMESIGSSPLDRLYDVLSSSIEIGYFHSQSTEIRRLLSKGVYLTSIDECESFIKIESSCRGLRYVIKSIDESPLTSLNKTVIRPWLDMLHTATDNLSALKTDMINLTQTVINPSIEKIEFFKKILSTGAKKIDAAVKAIEAITKADLALMRKDLCEEATAELCSKTEIYYQRLVSIGKYLIDSSKASVMLYDFLETNTLDYVVGLLDSTDFNNVKKRSEGLEDLLSALQNDLKTDVEEVTSQYNIIQEYIDLIMSLSPLSENMKLNCIELNDILRQPLDVLTMCYKFIKTVTTHLRSLKKSASSESFSFAEIIKQSGLKLQIEKVIHALDQLKVLLAQEAVEAIAQKFEENVKPLLVLTSEKIVDSTNETAMTFFAAISMSTEQKSFCKSVCDSLHQVQGVLLLMKRQVVYYRRKLAQVKEDILQARDGNLALVLGWCQNMKGSIDDVSILVTVTAEHNVRVLADTTMGVAVSELQDQNDCRFMCRSTLFRFT